MTIEPMINTGTWEIDTDLETGWAHKTLDGGLSCQYEHQFVITKDGPVILTSQGEEELTNMKRQGLMARLLDKLQWRPLQVYLRHYRSAEIDIFNYRSGLLSHFDGFSAHSHCSQYLSLSEY